MASRFAPAIDAVDNAIRHSTHFREWLRSRRWCGEAVGLRSEIAVKDRALLTESGTEAIVFFLAVVRQPEGQAVIHLPLSISESRVERDAFEVQVAEGRVFVTEAEPREAFVRFVADAFEHQSKVDTMAEDTLRFRGEPIGAFRAMGAPLAGDSTNLLVRFSTVRTEVVFKSYKLPDVRNREPEILERLHRKQFRNAPRYLGEVALGQGPERLVLGLATEFVESVDLFTWMTEGWRLELAPGGPPANGDFEPASLAVAAPRGEATAALHEALFDRHPGPWQAETFRGEDATAARRAAITNLGESLRRLAALAKGPDRRAAEVAAKARMFLFDQRPAIEEVLRGLDANLGTPKSVTHGDLHLGQVLRRTADGTLYFIDFEGEPERSPGQRSLKLPPLRDVATMNRSFSYVKHYAWRTAVGGDAMSATRLLERDALSEPERSLAARLLAWEAATMERFTGGYLARTTLYEGLRPEEAHRAIRGWMMEKALYEFRYELKYRPANIFIPLEGIVTLATGADA
jgi:trehalose synthase-fused probable maltokinase